MKTTHTPGPWTLEAGRNIKTQSGEFYVTYGKDKYGNPLFRDFCELDRNSRLIAAAPDLLEALDAMVEMYCSLVDSGDCGNWNPRNDKEVIQAMTAIAKARG